MSAYIVDGEEKTIDFEKDKVAWLEKCMISKPTDLITKGWLCPPDTPHYLYKDQDKGPPIVYPDSKQNTCNNDVQEPIRLLLQKAIRLTAKPHYENLKVLPKSVSKKENGPYIVHPVGLGVNYCPTHKGYHADQTRMYFSSRKRALRHTAGVNSDREHARTVNELHGTAMLARAEYDLFTPLRNRHTVDCTCNLATVRRAFKR